MANFWIRINERSGEREYGTYHILTVKKKKDYERGVRELMKTWYNDFTGMLDERKYEYGNGEIIVWVDNKGEIPDEDLKILKKYL